MRIAYVCADPGISALGDKGASVHLRSLAGALARRGHAVTLLSSRLDGANPPPPHVTLTQLSDGSLTQLLRDWRCEVVLERYSLTEQKVQESCRTLGIAHILEVNAPLVDEAARYRGLQDLAVWRAREGSVLRAADAVVDILLRAAVRLHTDVRVLIVGDGPERGKLEALASELRIADRVVFAGAVPHHAIPEHLAAMTVAAAPYLRQTDFYFSPLKIVEYLAAGLPVVASEQGDLAHLVGKAGLMVSPDDAVELADALDKVLGDPELRRAMHFAARRHAAGMSWYAAAAQVETALISAVARSRSAAFNRETA